ncbi:MAG TPA: hypothetical protein VGQ31_12675 [Candidatus Limnocylindrales bacterium]|nr:hypothetical protein [Candidatus Limnocylindrales bacterium]
MTTDPQVEPVEPAADTGAEDLVDGAEDLPPDIPDDDLAPEEFTAAQLDVDPDVDVPESGDKDGDDVEDDVDAAIALEAVAPNP